MNVETVVKDPDAKEKTNSTYVDQATATGPTISKQIFANLDKEEPYTGIDSQPAPVAGLIWNVNHLFAKKWEDKEVLTLLGSFEGDNQTPALPNLSIHLFKLDKDQPKEDIQTQHKQDEFYYLVSGKTSITYGQLLDAEGKLTGGVTKEMQPGDLIFIPASTQHTFHDYDKAEIMILFGPNYTGGPIKK